MLELRHMNFEGRDSTRDSDSMAASDVWEASEPASRAVRKTQWPGCVAAPARLALRRAPRERAPALESEDDSRCSRLAEQ